MSFDRTTQQEVRPCHIVITCTSGQEQYVPTHSHLWEPLGYLLLFPHGTLGWGKQGTLANVTHNEEDVNIDDNRNPQSTQIWHYHARILREPHFNIFGCLANEYIDDMFSHNLESRLWYICMNQERLRHEDAALMGVNDVVPSENVYLPVSFLGLSCWASDEIANSLAIASSLGSPTFFITITSNVNWPEIQSELLPGQSALDHPQVVCRVFKRKLSHLIRSLRSMFSHAGQLVYLVCSMEFQK